MEPRYREKRAAKKKPASFLCRAKKKDKCRAKCLYPTLDVSTCLQIKFSAKNEANCK